MPMAGLKISITMMSCAPTPQAGQVLVRVHAAGVNPFAKRRLCPIDWKIREGYFKQMFDLPLPVINQIEATVEKTFELSAAAAAQEFSQHGHPYGKLVLQVTH
jgi:NADPH:quinone reductase-like Zn-dependent oxidoreductase